MSEKTHIYIYDNMYKLEFLKTVYDASCYSKVVRKY